SAPAPSREGVQGPSGSRGEKPKSAPAAAPVQKIKAPRTAAVVLNNNGGTKSFAEVLTAARERVDLAKLGIDSLRIRPSANGGRVFEIKGENRAAKAAELAAELSKVVGPMGVTATCPERRVDLRVEGLCESATSCDVALALSRAGGCPVSEVLVRPPVGGGARSRLGFASVPAAAASAL
ncbi:histone H1-I-1, putative, partial [Pediculus humanus corporis]